MDTCNEYPILFSVSLKHYHTYGHQLACSRWLMAGFGFVWLSKIGFTWATAAHFLAEASIGKNFSNRLKVHPELWLTLRLLRHSMELKQVILTKPGFYF